MERRNGVERRRHPAEVHRLMDQALEKGKVEFAPGMFLESNKCLEAEQERWPESEPAKYIDASAASFWVTFDSGLPPMPMKSIDDIAECMEDI
ncbi:hypothetical protein [Marinobacter sp.]|uniref:hypothetical protein n=1 Tax=Marinobacter sp. TaxID=50741 RepID=UPI00384ADCA1